MSEVWSQSEWLVLPHTADRNAWRASLHQAAEKGGRTIVEWDSRDEADWSQKPIFLTADAATALSIQPDPSRIAAVFGVLDVALPDALDVQKRHEAVQATTDSFAQLALLPQERLFGPRYFEHKPLEVLPELVVVPPEATNKSRTALAKALGIHVRDEAVWPVEILSWIAPFRREDDMAVLDLTGRPRFLIFGPYIVMPPGRWKARFRFAVDSYASRYLFRVDWGQVEKYSSHEFRPGQAGVYEIETVFDWRERSACEFRLILREGAFHGEVSISDLTITRV